MVTTSSLSMPAYSSKNERGGDPLFTLAALNSYNSINGNTRHICQNVILKISFIEMFENTIHLFIIIANYLIYR